MNEFNIYVKVFVHYPEVYNANVINNRFEKYFEENEMWFSKYKGKSHVIFKTAPIDENQMIIIDIEFNDQIDKVLNKEKFESKLKEFIKVYFDRQVPEVIINYISLEKGC